MLILGSFPETELLLDVPGALDFWPDKVAERTAKISKYIRAIEDTCEIQQRSFGSFQIKSVEWQWMYGFGKGNSVSIREDKPITVAIQGNNASGKTAFVDVVTLGLFGKESVKRESKLRPASMVCDTKPNDAVAWIEVVVDVDRSMFRIRREFSSKKDGKLAKTAMVTAEGSGAIVVSGKSETDDWVNRFITHDDFMMVDRRDNDLLSMSPSDQKDFMDMALKTANTQAQLDAVNESQKGHAWLGKGLIAAAESSLINPDDPSNEILSGVMYDAKRASAETCILKAKLAFAKIARKIFSDKRNMAKRLKQIQGVVIPRNVDEVELSGLRKRVADADKLFRAAESELRANERSYVAPPAPQTSSSNDSIEYLEEKTTKYKRASIIKTRLEGLGQPCAFNDGCWACMEREGENVRTRLECEQELHEIGVFGTMDDIAKKTRGYERRLAQAQERMDREVRSLEWSKTHDMIVAKSNETRENLLQVSLELDEAVLARDLYLSGGDPSALEGAEDSGLVEILNKKLSAARRREADLRVKASEFRLMRRTANNQRARANTYMKTGQDLLEKSKALKLSHTQANQRFEDSFCEAVEKLADETNAVLASAYPYLSVEAEWHYRTSFVLWVRNGNGIRLPIEKASGFERSAVSLALKAALKKVGYASSSGWMLVDEATAGFDDANASLLSKMLDAISKETGSHVMALTQRSIEGVDCKCEIVTNNGSSSLFLRRPDCE